MKKDIYNDQTYLANNPTWHEEDAIFKADHIERILRKHPVQFETVCEVGCGSGEILVQLQKRFTEVQKWVGYDISTDAIAIAGTKANDHLKFELQDIALVEKSISFDVMLVIDVIEHLENYFSFLDSITEKSTYFIFHIPLDMCVWSLLREGILIESKKRVGHIHNFSEDFIKSILEDHGFRILAQLYTEPVAKVISVKYRIINLARKILYFFSPKFCSKTLGGYSIMVLAEVKK
jgi:predicted TPR repeat methyltransferase